MQREEVLRDKITIWDQFLEQGRSDGGKGGRILNGGPSKNEKCQEKLTQQEPNQTDKIAKKRGISKGGKNMVQNEEKIRTKHVF